MNGVEPQDTVMFEIPPPAYDHQACGAPPSYEQITAGSMAAPGGDWEMKTTPTGQTYYEVLLLLQMLLSIQYCCVDIQC
jgi:hypothetical protein